MHHAVREPANAAPTARCRSGGTMPTVRLSCVVMTHPSRMPHAVALRDGHPELDLTIVVDPAPDEGPSALRTAKVAWNAVAPDASHHLVLQDDALLGPSFVAHLESAIAAAPDRPLSLFADWGTFSAYGVRLAALAGVAWAEVADPYVPSLAMVLPAPVAREFARFEGHAGPEDDIALRVFLSGIGLTPWVTVPNLVDHLQLPSLTGNDWQGERPAVCLTVDGMSEIAWWTEPPALRALPVFWWPSGFAVWVAPEGRGRWRGVPVESILPEYGEDPAAVAALGQLAVTAWSAAMPDLDPKLLRELWTAAYGLGLALADAVGTGPARLEEALARPVARRALATMPGGALRFVVDARRLSEVTGDLCPLVEQGIRQGHGASRARAGADR